MRSFDVRQAYLNFFASQSHQVIPSAPLVPENDPTTLFTSSGMQPLIPYLLGQPHPLGNRLTNSQKCFRSQDIDEVGDNRHTTFFEMLGNWSLGSYFKSEQLSWFYSFITTQLHLSPAQLWVSVFAGNSTVPKDTESADIWVKLGIDPSHIHYYDAKKNWWSRSGPPDSMPPGEPGGPDSEVFFDFGPHRQLHEVSIWKDQPCHPNCDCGRFLEIGNSVFMQYQKQADGSLKPLPQRNVDFGGGLERFTAATTDQPDIFLTDLFSPLLDQISSFTGQSYSNNSAAFRIIADHLKAATFLIADGVTPSNKTQGYFLRRLIRRSLVKLQQLSGDLLNPVDAAFYDQLVSAVFAIYAGVYFSSTDKSALVTVLSEESLKFNRTLREGLKKLPSTSPFDLFQSYGFPPEVTAELYQQQGKTFDWDIFNAQLKAHQDSSRTASVGMFKGGLENHSDITTKYHTATHLLHTALRHHLGAAVSQKGSNITSERLRFDFSYPHKLTSDQIQLIEQEVNNQISANLPVTRQEISKTDALSRGALAFFPEKYPDQVSVYFVGDPSHPYSFELCGGPHVTSTGSIGRIKITKEEGVSAGVRRLYAQLV